jgi:hypothetical protein
MAPQMSAERLIGSALALVLLLAGCGGATTTTPHASAPTEPDPAVLAAAIPPLERIAVPPATLRGLKPIVVPLHNAGFFSAAGSDDPDEIAKFVYRQNLVNRLADEVAFAFPDEPVELTETDPSVLATRTVTSPEQISPNVDDIDLEDPEFALLETAAVDRTRVWYADPEADVTEGNHVYVDAVTDWARISQGTFAPTDVRETWESDTGPVRVTFTESRRRHDIQLRHLDDWMDMELLCKIEAVTQPRGLRFMTAETGGQDVFVAGLRLSETRLLEKAGWHFGEACALSARSGGYRDVEAEVFDGLIP